VALLGPTEIELAHAEVIVEVFLADHDLALGGLELDALDRLAADLGDLALERAHTGLARVVADDAADRALGDLELLVLHAVVLALLGQQVALRDVDLLVLGVARE